MIENFFILINIFIIEIDVNNILKYIFYYLIIMEFLLLGLGL